MATTDREHVRRLREEANAIRRREEAARKRRRALTAGGIILGAVVVIGAIVLVSIFGPQWFGKPGASPSGPIAANGEVQVTTSDGRQLDVPIATEDDGAAIALGQARAPVTIDYWFDFSCPHCIDYHLATSQTIHDLVASGQARVKFHPVNIVAPYGKPAAGALLAVVAHEPGRFLAAYDGLFAIPAQTQMSWSDADYANVLGQFGAQDPATIADVKAGAYDEKIPEFTQKAKDAGMKGTPSVAVNGTMAETIPGPQQLIELVGQNGGDVSQIPVAPAA